VKITHSYLANGGNGLRMDQVQPREEVKKRIKKRRRKTARMRGIDTTVTKKRKIIILGQELEM